MIYAYIQRATVMLVERRLENQPYTDSLTPLIEAKLYNGALIPFFKPVPVAVQDRIRIGWCYDSERGFHEPQPFEVNTETGEMYLPAQISTSDFYDTMMKTQKSEADIADLGLVSIEFDAALVEQYETQVAQDASIIELYEMIGGQTK